MYDIESLYEATSVADACQALAAEYVSRREKLDAALAEIARREKLDVEANTVEVAQCEAEITTAIAMLARRDGKDVADRAIKALDKMALVLHRQHNQLAAARPVMQAAIAGYEDVDFAPSGLMTALWYAIDALTPEQREEWR